jgi:energy-coupling factor transporter ATP-binding protein EcfA2
VGWGKPERGPISGPPGSGKSTYIRAIERVAQSIGKPVIVIRAKECSAENVITVSMEQSEIIRKISGILHFTTGDGLRPSFDVLAASSCNDISCLKEFIYKKFKQDIATWIEARLAVLEQIFIGDGIIKIPTCLTFYDEIVRRMAMGVLYVARHKITKPVIIDDKLALVTNEPYDDAYIAMMRPSKIAINRFIDTKEMLAFNPIVLSPGGAAGIYRLSRPERYTIIFDHNRWELSRREIEKIAYS